MEEVGVKSENFEEKNGVWILGDRFGGKGVFI